MSSFFLSIYHYFSKHKWLLVVLVLGITGVMIFIATRIKLEEDITRFIPSDDKVKKYTSVFQNLRVNDKIVIAIHLPDSTTQPDQNELIAYGDELVKYLKEKYQGSLIREITFRLSGDMMKDAYDIFYRNLPYFLDSADYIAMDTMLSVRNIESSISKDFHTLVSPAGVAFKKFIARDPLGFTKLAVAKLSYLQVQGNFVIYNDCIFTKDKKNLLLFVNSAFPSNETSVNADLIDGIDKGIKQTSENFKNKITAGYYGAVAVAAGNAKQMKRDSMVTMGIAIVVLIILLSFFYRKKRVLLYIMLPVAMGALFSLAMMQLIRGELSTIAIGAGSIVFGIAINYSIHYFTHLKHTNSPEACLRDLSIPMTIGSITTIGAFLSLLFVKSHALQDFGLFAALVLIGAVLFTLIVLPHLMKKYNTISEEYKPSHTIFERFSETHFEKSKIWLAVIGVLTLFFLYFAPQVGFDSDMSKMNYVPDELRATERRLNMITDSNLRAIYVVSTGKNLDEAMKHSEQVAGGIEKLKRQNLVHTYNTPGILLQSDSVKRIKINNWQNFWTQERKDSLGQRLSRIGSVNNFSSDAFQPFIDFIGKTDKKYDKADAEKLRKLFVDDYITENSDEAMIVTLLKVKDENRQKVVDALPENENTVIVDRQYMTSVFADVINNDFNTILLFSSLLVFIFLVGSYGRFELGLLAFIPMLISWIWILGIMALTGIKFNVFSIILSAFIFGLGDDYSIFIMDGLLQEYKTGKKNLGSFKTAVFISALTTVIGVGVLIFAKHPALRSIALTTIVGMLSVVLVSYTVAPAIFRWMIYTKKRKRAFPVTLGGLLYAIVCYSYFIGGCVFTVLMGWTVIRVLPFGQKKRKLAYHKLLSFVCRSTIFIMYMVKKRFINYNKDTFKKPALVICNHQSIIDVPLALMFTPKMIMITNERVYYSPLIGKLVQLGGFFPASSGYEDISIKLKELIKDGYSIFVFPEGTRADDRKVKRFHKGAFFLAEQLGIDILPMVMHGTGEYIRKGEYFGRRSTITVKFLDRITPDDKSWGNTYSERTKSIQKACHKEFYQIKEKYYTDPDYHKDLLIRNFIYKGPILEWYMRVKLRLEGNYRFFNDLLPKKGHITDVGCGYGFLSYMLALISEERQITGIDYDEDKIDVARSGISRPANTEFICGDVLNIPFKPSKAFVIADVLHYMPEEWQRSVILKCTENLEPDGLIIIRDGDSSMEKKHKGTKLTEFFSTKVLGFNKTGTDNKLYFTSRETIFDTLKNHKFAVEIVDETHFTSNVFYIIRHADE
jgi:uncharacterized protein